MHGCVGRLFLIVHEEEVFVSGMERTETKACFNVKDQIANVQV